MEIYDYGHIFILFLYDNEYQPLDEAERWNERN